MLPLAQINGFTMIEVGIAYDSDGTTNVLHMPQSMLHVVGQTV